MYNGHMKFIALLLALSLSHACVTADKVHVDPAVIRTCVHQLGREGVAKDPAYRICDSEERSKKVIKNREMNLWGMSILYLVTSVISAWQLGAKEAELDDLRYRRRPIRR